MDRLFDDSNVRTEGYRRDISRTDLQEPQDLFGTASAESLRRNQLVLSIQDPGTEW